MKKDPAMKMKKAPTKKVSSGSVKMAKGILAAAKKEENSALAMKKAAMKLKKDSVMMMKKAAMKMKRVSAMKMKMKKSAVKMGHKKK